jgi:hypothetical protein
MAERVVHIARILELLQLHLEHSILHGTLNLSKDIIKKPSSKYTRGCLGAD